MLDGRQRIFLRVWEVLSMTLTGMELQMGGICMGMLRQTRVA